MTQWTQKQKKILNRFIAKLTSLYKKEYINTLDEVKGLVLDLYTKISVDNKPLLSHLYQFKRYYKLTKDIQDKLTSLGIKQERLFTEELEKYYKANAEMLADQFEIPFETTDKRIKELVESYLIDNTLWRESIWKDKALLLSKVRHQLVLNVSLGKSIDDMASDLQPETLTSNFANAKRLVRTELVKYYSANTLDSYRAAGITKVQRHCVMDDRTCQECASHNNEIYPIDKADGVIPAHPNCRDWWTPVIE